MDLPTRATVIAVALMLAWAAWSVALCGRGRARAVGSETEIAR